MTLVYAYGAAGPPVSGLEDAQREIARCVGFWNALVAIDHDLAACELAQAKVDRPRLARIYIQIADIESMTERWPKALRLRRSRLYGIARRALNRWRKKRAPFLRELEKTRRERSKVLRRSFTAVSDDPLYWGNSNRVMQSYETGRKVARKKGRLLKPADPARDNGVLTVQIQRTASGLGADPEELFNERAPADLRFTAPGTSGQSYCSIRVDALGHHLVLPVWLHRPLPAGCRIKQAQVTYRRRGTRLIWKLCLTIDPSHCVVPLFKPMRSASSGVRVEFAWSNQGHLEVMRCGIDVWRLSDAWMQRVDNLERRCGWLDEALNTARDRWGDHPVMGPLLSLPHWSDRIREIALARPALTGIQILWWVETRRLWLAIPGERAHILGDRQNTYQHWARELVSRYPALVLDNINLAQYAREMHGDEANSYRHRAAIHTLRQAIEHQAHKAGTPILDSRGQVLNAPSEAKSNTWARRKAAKQDRSQKPVQGDDPKGDTT